MDLAQLAALNEVFCRKAIRRTASGQVGRNNSLVFSRGFNRPPAFPRVVA
jgi:hypothetical protein